MLGKEAPSGLLAPQEFCLAPQPEASPFAPPCVNLKYLLWGRGEGEILKVEYYFEYISGFFLIPPSAPQKAVKVIFPYGCLPNTLWSESPHFRLICMFYTVLYFVCDSLSSQTTCPMADV